MTFVTALAGVVVSVTAGFRVGVGLVGVAALLAALLRGVLAGAAGLLVVRSRWLDVLVTGALGVGLVVLAAVVPPG